MFNYWCLHMEMAEDGLTANEILKWVSLSIFDLLSMHGTECCLPAFISCLLYIAILLNARSASTFLLLQGCFYSFTISPQPSGPLVISSVENEFVMSVAGLHWSSSHFAGYSVWSLFVLSKVFGQSSLKNNAFIKEIACHLWKLEIRNQWKLPVIFSHFK